jgi:hypothetical protein
VEHESDRSARNRAAIRRAALLDKAIALHARVGIALQAGAVRLQSAGETLAQCQRTMDAAHIRLRPR